MGCASRGMTQRAAPGHCYHCSGEGTVEADPLGGACENPEEQRRAMKITQEWGKDYVMLSL